MVQIWNNSDNLTLKFGPDKATAKTAGEYSPWKGMHEVEIRLDLMSVDGAALTETETVLDNTVTIPSGARIQEVELYCTTAGATGVAIDVGLAKRVTAGATTLTEIDYDGLLAAAPVTIFDLAGERTIFTAASTVPASATGTGALIGTTTTSVGLITASRTTATAFTAGVVVITIRYYMP